MNRLLILFLIMVLSAFAVAQDVTPPPVPEEPNGPSAEDRHFESLLEIQKNILLNYQALLRRMRVAAAHGDERTRERLQKAVALMDELAIGYQMEKLSGLIKDRLVHSAMAKAQWISEKIASILSVLDGMDPDWKPDSRIPTLEEQLEKLKSLRERHGELREKTQDLGERSELSDEDKLKLENLEGQLRELADETQELGEGLPDEIKPLMDKAKDLMGQAADQLQQENLQGAEERQGDADSRLDEAQRKIEDQLRKYRERQNDNLLIHIEQKLKRIRAQQVVVNDLTIETYLKAEGGERVSRRAWRSIYSKQRKNSKEAEAVAEKLLHGNVPIFGRVMAGVGRDMVKAAKLLKARDGGEFTQEIQEDIRATLDDLLDALRAERTRRQNEEGGPPQQTSPDGSPPKPRLVPLPAELGILLKRQQYLRHKHQRFMDRFPEVRDRANMTNSQRRIYERLSQEQGENAGYLDSLFDSLFNR